MLVYNYHFENGEYLGSSEADESPLEPGVFLVPAYATDLEPPSAQEGFIRCFVNGAWTYAEIAAPEEPQPQPPEQPIDPLLIPLQRLDFWLVAAEAGISKWAVRDTIAAMPDGTEKYAAIAWFEDAPSYTRHDPLLNELAAGQGVSPAQLDALWIWAQP